jgi:hypothetical protein
VCGKVVALGKGVVVEFGAGGIEHKTCEKRRENPAVDQHQQYTTTVRHGGDKRRAYKTRTTGVPEATNT